MKSFIIFPLVLLFIAACDAHTRVSNVTINGRTTNECLRPGSSSNPIMSSDGDRNGLMEANYTCGFLPNAARAATASCSIAAGSEMNISYYHGANYGDETPEKDYWIASSHRGPFLAYMARWENSSGIPSGLAWFKIFHSGITKNATGDYKTIQWASPDTLNSNNGAMTVRIPAQLAPGRYLLRTEIIALHDNKERGAQPYVRCIDLTVTGSGRSVPKDLVALPGAIGYNDTGLRFSVYQTRNQNYPIPGPSVFDFSRSPSIPSGNGTIVDISCAGFPDGACPSPSTCNLATGRCQCPTGTRMQGFQCTGATSATKASTNAASSTVRSTNAATSSTKGSSNAASSSTRPTNSTARSSDAASSSTRGSTTAISSNKGSTNFTGSSNNQGSVSSEIEEVTSDASMFVISGMLTIISLFL